jgi:hypothetical protein
MEVDQAVMVYFANRDRCVQCKTKFDKPILMPAGCKEDNCLAINPEFLWHMRDTHGLPEDMYREWLLNAIHGKPIEDHYEGGVMPLCAVHQLSPCLFQRP